MKSLIKQMDFTTSIPNFYYDGQPRYKTLLGGVIQIIITMIWFAGILFFTKDMYLKENPSVIASTEYDRIPYERNYTNLDDIMFMVSLNDPNTWAPFIDETYYTVKFITIIKQNQQKGPSQLLKTERCRMEFFKGKENFVTGIPIENYFCLSPDVKDVTFKGTQTSPDSKFIKIGVHMCMNSTENNNFCKTPEEITDKLAGSSFNLFFFNNKFETKNFKNPNEQFLDFHHSFYSNLYYKLVFVTLKQVRYIDDVGFFSESLESHDYFGVNDIKEVFNFEKQADGKFLDFAVNFGTNRENTRRNYKKIQSAIAEVGGLFKGIYLIMIIIRTFMMEDHVYEYLNYFILSDKVFTGISGDKHEGNFNINQIYTKLKNLKNEKSIEQENKNLSNDAEKFKKINLNINQSYPDNPQANIESSKTNIQPITKHNESINDVSLFNTEKDIKITNKSKFGLKGNNNNQADKENDITENNMEIINIKNNLKSITSNNSKTQLNSNKKSNLSDSNQILDKSEDFLLKSDAGKIFTAKHNMNQTIIETNIKQNVDALKKNFNLNDFKKQKSILDTEYNTNIKNFHRIKRNNTNNIYENQKKIPKNFEVLAMNYLSQKEILKLITDFTLFRSLVFNAEQNLEFEEMSRNLDLITKVMIERETILAKLLTASDKNFESIGKVDNAKMIMRFKEIN
jgi:hypothetical protein